MPISFSAPARQGEPGVAGAAVTNALQGAAGRFYKVVAGTLRNTGTADYWQPLVDTSNRPQNIDVVTTTPTAVRVEFPGLSATHVGSVVAVPDDVLGEQGIRIVTNSTRTAVDLTFLQTTTLSDLIYWDGAGWTRSKGSASPFTVLGTGTIAHDAQTQTAAFNTAAVSNTTHTPVGTPKGVAVIIIQQVSTTDEISGVTYGGVAMTRVRKQDRTGSMTETGSIYEYFLGASIPTGPQTVAITSTGTQNKRAVISTVTADTSTTAVDVSNGSALNTGANPSLLLTFSGLLADAVAYYGIGTGLAAPVTTAQAGSTHQFSHDFGGESAMWARKDISGATSTTMGYTATSDDQLQAGMVIKAAAAGAFTGTLEIAHADLGAVDPLAVSVVAQGGVYNVVVANTALGLTGTGVKLEFYNATTGTKATTADTSMRFILSRPSANRVLNPQTITTGTYPNADITLYGVYEVLAPDVNPDPPPPEEEPDPPPVVVPPSGGGPPAPTPLPDGGLNAEDSRTVALTPYKADWFAPTSYWKRQLPGTVGGRNAILFQHATQPLANSANWVAYLCTNMGFDPATPPENLIPNYLPTHTAGQAWLRREGDMLYIVPPDQPYRDFFNIQAGIDTWATRMQAVIDRLGGLPVPYDVEGTSNPDRYVHVYKPDENMFIQAYLAGQLVAATTTLSYTGGVPSSGEFHLAIDYGDNMVNLATYTTQTPIPWNATAAQVKASIDGARNPSNATFQAGNASKVTCTGGPLNVAPIETRYGISKPLLPVGARVTTSTLNTGTVAFSYVNAGPVERCRGGAVIAELDDHPGVDLHPGTYRDWTFGGQFLEDFRWGGSATSIEYMAGIPSYDEVQIAQANGTGLDHALIMVVGHAQLSPISRVIPALRSDGDRPNRPDAIAEGARVAFPPDVDLSAVPDEFLWVAKTIRDYGVIIYDKTGSGCELVFRRASWPGSTFNPWAAMLPLYASQGDAAHRYMRSLPWHKAQIIDPNFSAI